jgi:hypothetical protein
LIDVGDPAVLGEDAAARVGDRREHMAMSEVDRSNEALGRIREEQRGWPAAAEPGIRPALGDQMLGDQILDTFGGGAPREPGQPAELSAGYARMLPDGAEQQLVGALPPR